MTVPLDPEYILSLLPILTLLALIIYVSCSVVVYLVLQLFRLRKIFVSSTGKHGTTKSSFHRDSNFSFRSRGYSIVIFAISYIIAHLPIENTSGLHDLLMGTDRRLQTILEKTPSLSRGPNPPFLFANRHIQLVPWLIQNELHRREGIPFQRLNFQVTGCEDKSTVTSELNCDPSPNMNDNITLDIFPPLQNVNSTYNKQFNWSSPIILFAPGLRCESQDMPGNMIIRRAYSEGFRAIVVNRRGHTSFQQLKAPRWSLFGDVDDMEQVYWFVKNHLAAPNTPLFLHGISSGTAVVVSGVSKWDKRKSLYPSRPAPSFVAAISITPGYDTSTVLKPERFRFPYNDILTPLVKYTFVQQNENLLRSYNSEAVDAALNATSLQEFLDASAPFAGYSNASEYYKHENPVNEVQYITTPKLVLNSFDDPCCKISNLYEESSIEEHQGKTYAQLVRESQRTIVVVTRSGSHCPFLDGDNTIFPALMKDPLYGGWMLDSWADRVSIEFYRAALDVYADRRFL